MLRLGYLDLPGLLEHTVELAPLADRLGWSRYWLTEFPPQPSPIITAGIVAGLTERIRVGTAAVLLTFYPPKRTAHDFQLLERLYEGRIDAGVSSSTASIEQIRDDLDGRDVQALAAGYPERFATFMRHLRNTPGSETYEPKSAWVGAPEAPPEVWSLGQYRAAEVAARHGTAFGYPLMYGASVDDPALSLQYRATCTGTPHSVLSVTGYCAETDEQARALAESWAIFSPHVIGSPATCVARFAELRERYQADEIIWADMRRELPARLWSIEALSAAARSVPSLCM